MVGKDITLPPKKFLPGRTGAEKAMNHKERFFATIERRSVDRPCTWLGLPVPEAQERLFAYFGAADIPGHYAVLGVIWSAHFQDACAISPGQGNGATGPGKGPGAQAAVSHRTHHFAES